MLLVPGDPRDWAAIGQFALDDGVVDGRRLFSRGWDGGGHDEHHRRDARGRELRPGWWLNCNVDGSPGLHSPADTYRASGHDGQRLFSPWQGLVIARLGFSPDLHGDAGGPRRRYLLGLVSSLMASSKSEVDVTPPLVRCAAVEYRVDGRSHQVRAAPATVRSVARWCMAAASRLHRGP
ncbi:MAG: hypothetical protein IPJ61_17850 [Tessaracoccus sp.]|uniref:hypothetical protein n=1 Tax=Tessaracoccus sp. TaxID=1971211 RepID=UPI001EB2C2C9|nr:hypothetical protein [Tessaracoccus sp.]MBK7822868.1 hypothetical protein [Tessaracoccus sp.]